MGASGSSLHERVTRRHSHQDLKTFLMGLHGEETDPTATVWRRWESDGQLRTDMVNKSEDRPPSPLPSPQRRPSPPPPDDSDSNLCVTSSRTDSLVHDFVACIEDCRYLPSCVRPKRRRRTWTCQALRVGRLVRSHGRDATAQWRREAFAGTSCATDYRPTRRTRRGRPRTSSTRRFAL